MKKTVAKKPSAHVWKCYGKGKLVAADVAEIVLGAVGWRENGSKSCKRMLADDAILPPVYLRKVPMWDEESGTSTLQDLAFAPIHESLNAIVTEEWATFTDE